MKKISTGKILPESTAWCRSYYTRLLPLKGQRQSKLLRGYLLNYMAVATRELEDYQQALEWYFQALSFRLAPPLPAGIAVADTLNNIALLHQDHGETFTATSYLLRAIARYPQLPAPKYSLILAKKNLAGVYWAQDDNEKARAILQTQLGISSSAMGPQHRYSNQDYPDHLTPIIVLAYHTGFDIGDIFELHWEHIDFANNQIRKFATRPVTRRITLGP